MSFGQYIYLVKSDREEYDPSSSDWINSFKRFLELLLCKLSGEVVKINEVTTDDLSTDSIYTSNTILIPIVSADLLDSIEFKDELKVFHENAINKGHNSIPWNSRIFKVLREPQQGHFLLDYLSDSLSYDFFHFDASLDELVIYDDFTGPTSEKTFWMRLYDLAYDIYKVAGTLSNVDSAIADLTSDLNGCTVFLAEVGSDLIGERDAVKRELQRSGIKVLPDKNMPGDLDAIKKYIRKELKKCNMSIHLVGSEDQAIDKSKSSLIDVQNKMASEHFNELEKLGQKSQPNLGKVVWISPEAVNASVKQRLFIEDLKKDDGAINDTDLLETSIEELKTYVLTKVNKGVEQLKKVNEFQGDEKKVIYLIHEQEDVSKCSKIKSLLKENGFNVISSDFSGNPDHIRAKHDDNLKRCDATLIYYGHENESWIKSKQKELQKSLGFGREKPLGPQAIIVENEQDDLLSRLGIDDNAIILKSKSNLSEEHFEPFLERLKE